jgi:hypothetical protein
MTPDQMISINPRYTALLDKAGLDVMIYHGNLDPCFTTAGEEAWLQCVYQVPVLLFFWPNAVFLPSACAPLDV